MLPVIVIFLFMVLFDTIGTLIGSSTVSSYIESAAGVAEGGRTGLTAIVVGVLFRPTMFFSPLVEMIGGGVAVSRSIGVGAGASEIQVVLLPVVAPVMILVGLKTAAAVEGP